MIQCVVSFNFKYDRVSNYDRTFHIKSGYCSELQRDDREHTRGLNVNAGVGVFVCFRFELFYRFYWQTPLTD